MRTHSRVVLASVVGVGVLMILLLGFHGKSSIKLLVWLFYSVLFGSLLGRQGEPA